MGTEVAISFSSLREQLENEKSTLFKIDASIKKIVQNTGRYSDRFNNSSVDFGRGGPRLGSRNSYPDSGNQYKNDDPPAKRKPETKTVFSRLSRQESDGEDVSGIKRSRVSSAVSRELPTRAAVLRAQGGDEQARTRNRRMFGSLLGTLQKFKQEEIELQTKEEKKAQVERKIEEQARQQKEKEQKERKVLFAEREHKKATIKALEAKIGRVQEFEKWEASQKYLSNFILTKTRPHMYWLPNKMSDTAAEKLEASKKVNEKYLMKKRVELQEELVRIEQRCLRPRGAKENDPEPAPAGEGEGEPAPGERGEGGGRKRDKFAVDGDQKEESDGDEHVESEAVKEAAEESQVEENKTEEEMETTEERTETMETEVTQESTQIPSEPETSQPDVTSPHEDVASPAEDVTSLPEDGDVDAEHS